METEKKWLWKATMAEMFFDASNRFQTFMVSYQLTVATAAPLLEDQVTSALSHLYRKTPNLRACFDQRDGTTWLREMAQEKIDFEMLPETASVAETLQKLRNYHYDSNAGPLWCAKLRPGPPSEGAANEMQGFPHLYTFFLGFHHGITDGTSTMKICGFLVQLLNDVISGKTIDDVEQFGVFISGEVTHKIVNKRVAAMRADPEILQKMIGESEAHKSNCSILNLTYKDAREDECNTKYITRDLDVATTSAFFQKCRAESVTINTAFAALANAAMVDLLALGGLEQESYKIVACAGTGMRTARSTSGATFCRRCPYLSKCQDISATSSGIMQDQCTRKFKANSRPKQWCERRRSRPISCRKTQTSMSSSKALSHLMTTRATSVCPTWAM
nr:uncharacterized protein LOC113824539 [Penaeus vannamei]XP_027233080.1 uncharacterized protein LOC113824539 [Penaeus vannamei]